MNVPINILEQYIDQEAKILQEHLAKDPLDAISRIKLFVQEIEGLCSVLFRDHIKHNSYISVSDRPWMVRVKDAYLPHLEQWIPEQHRALFSTKIHHLRQKISFILETACEPDLHRMEKICMDGVVMDVPVAIYLLQELQKFVRMQRLEETLAPMDQNRIHIFLAAMPFLLRSLDAPDQDVALSCARELRTDLAALLKKSSS